MRDSDLGIYLAVITAVPVRAARRDRECLFSPPRSAASTGRAISALANPHLVGGTGGVSRQKGNSNAVRARKRGCACAAGTGTDGGGMLSDANLHPDPRSIFGTRDVISRHL